MKSKITLVFEKCKKEKRPALITYTVAGDNTKNNSLIWNQSDGCTYRGGHDNLHTRAANVDEENDVFRFVFRFVYLFVR